MKKKALFAVCLVLLCLSTACAGKTEPAEETKVTETPVPTATEAAAPTAEPQNENSDFTGEENMNVDVKELFTNLKVANGYKGFQDSNPIMTQTYGADPFAITYDGRVYIYMTHDVIETDAKGEIKDNGYSKINTIRVVSTDDFVNYTDHGAIKVAGSEGAAKWARNSWAPAACWKNIDGQDKFFLYFADSGNGIGVLVADTPYGPFTDPLGHAIIHRGMENCGNVAWLFDPAVLVDDDGTGYIYFGGGPNPESAEWPGMGRCAKLSDDMISIDGPVVKIDVPFLFEDSGIHKFNNKYYYSYCSNFSVDAAGTEKYGFVSGEICVMESENPLGPFVYKERILKNPGAVFGDGGNNHHCVFTFNDKWYITYHAQLLSAAQNIRHGYRSTNVNEFEMGEDGTIGSIKMTKAGVAQLKNVNPYVENVAASGAIFAGLNAAAADAESKKAGSGKMVLSEIETGDYVLVRGVDFGEASPKKVTVSLRRSGNIEGECALKISCDKAFSEGFCYGLMTKELTEAPVGSFFEMTFDLDKEVTGVQDINFVFVGSGFEVNSWKFEK